MSDDARRDDRKLSKGGRHEEALDVARQVLRIEAATISDLARDFDAEAFDDALEAMLRCKGRIVCMGMGKSGIIAKKIAGTLASTGSPALFLHPAEAGHGDLGMLTDGDLVIALSHSGETAEVIALLPAIRRLDVRLIALVGDRESTVAREADVVLHVGVEEEACPLRLAPTASTTAALALGDALAMALLHERGFGVDEFAAMHPRGSLGRKLLRVRAVMHRGADVPAVGPTATLREVARVMTSKRLGMTAVVDTDGKVLGIVTDGDVRRLVEGDLEPRSQRAEAFMTREPAVISGDALATEALRELEARKITSLLVVDSGHRLEGVVHLHDLWRTEMI